jgi:hypothetical protein
VTASVNISRNLCIAVPKKKPGLLMIAVSLSQLLRAPVSGGIGRDVEVDDSSSVASRADIVAFFSTLVSLFFHVFRSRRTILSEITLVKKENENRLRRLGRRGLNWMHGTSFYVVAIGRIRGFGGRFRSLVSQRRRRVLQGFEVWLRGQTSEPDAETRRNHPNIPYSRDCP